MPTAEQLAATHVAVPGPSGRPWLMLRTTAERLGGAPRIEAGRKRDGDLESWLAERNRRAS